MIDSPGVIRVTFYPGAVDVYLKKFRDKSVAIRFELAKPPNAPATKQVPKQWYCRLDKTTWGERKAEITAR